MRKLFGILAVGALALATPAKAAPVSVPVNATLSILIQGLSPVSLSGSGSVTVETTTGAISVPAGLVTLASPVTVVVTAATAINSLTAVVAANQSGTFSVGGVTAQNASELCGGTPIAAGVACDVGGGLGGAMGLAGVINVHIIPNVVVIPVSLNDALVGQGGSTNQPFIFDAALWTTNTGLVNSFSSPSNVNGTTVATTGQSGNLLTGGTVVLVTPTYVNALANVLPLFTSLTLTPAPEPGTLLLLGTGIAGLAFVGRRRK